MYKKKILIFTATYNEKKQLIYGPGPTKIVGRDYRFMGSGPFELNLESKTVRVPGDVEGQVEPPKNR